MPPFSWTKMFEETGLSADNKTVLSAAADEAFDVHLVDLGSVKLNHTRNRGKMAEAIKDIVKKCKCLQDLPAATQEIAADHLRRRATQWKGHLEQEKPPSKSQKPSAAIQGLTTDLPPDSSSSSSEPASPRPAQPQPQPQPRHPTQASHRKPYDHTSVSTRSRTHAAKEKDIQSAVDPNSAALGPTKNTNPPSRIDFCYSRVHKEYHTISSSGLCCSSFCKEYHALPHISLCYSSFYEKYHTLLSYFSLCHGKSYGEYHALSHTSLCRSRSYE
ncbi:hypothetical protein DL95DRAFT_468171 [Leptodontidium sp. 2 PMI_412]|nr:hypothetical protein DL95DRAFT_468171 [Leptodontidium sp. 2 PMI_412]